MVAKFPIYRWALQQMVKLDLINLRILRELRTNGRLPNTQLADRVGLSPPACLRRVQELERSGAIAGYHAAIDRSVLGRNFVVFANVSLSDHSRASLRRFEETVMALPDVVECHKVTGAIEFVLRIDVENSNAYDRFHSGVLSTIPNVFSISTYVVINSIVNDIKGPLETNLIN